MNSIILLGPDEHTPFITATVRLSSMHTTADFEYAIKAIQMAKEQLVGILKTFPQPEAKNQLETFLDSERVKAASFPALPQGEQTKQQ